MNEKSKLKLYMEMLKIRLLEEKISDEYKNNEMKTPVHLSVGQEAIAVGVCSHLQKKDLVFSNHRCHAHYIAKGGNIKAMFAELFCKEHGCGGGYSGSMHLVDVEQGFPGASSIVSGGIPLSVGAAFAFKYRKEPFISISFFGDGAADEGVTYESVNFAAFHGLPILFVCENNEIAVASPYHQRQIVPIYKRFENMLEVHFINGDNLEEVEKVSGELIAEIRQGGGPKFIECSTHRWKAHCGDSSNPSVSEETIKRWKENCPIKTYREKLIEESVLTEKLDEEIKLKLKKEIEEAFLFGRNDISPKRDQLLNKMFAE